MSHPPIDPIIPLILDLDGTLVRNDMTHELVLATALHSPGDFPKALKLGKTDKPAMKAFMYDRHGQRLAVDHLPYQPAIVSLAEQYRSGGAKVYLCSGSIQQTVDGVVDHLDWIEDGWGTTRALNLTSQNKADFLKTQFPNGFDYAGNSTQDYAVWKEARRAYAIHPPSDTHSRVSATGDPVEILEPRATGLAAMAKLFMSGPWLQGLLIFLVPFFVNTMNLITVATAYLAFGCLGTAIRTLGKLYHINTDRRDPSRRKTDLPSGRVSIPQAGVVVGLSLVLGLGIASMASLSIAIKTALLAYPVLGILALRAGLFRTKCPVPRLISVLVPLAFGAALALF